jgi:hypothetical protein
MAFPPIGLDPRPDPEASGGRKHTLKECWNQSHLPLPREDRLTSKDLIAEKLACAVSAWMTLPATIDR